MLVVPLDGDKIETKDGTTLIVSGFTNYKSKGPAVYCRPEAGDSIDKPLIVPIYFFDIDKINDVRVEFNSSSKVFNALGRIKRKIQLPQQHDKIIIKGENDEDEELKVIGLLLHNRKYGTSKGLLISCENDKVVPLHDIIDIKRDFGSSEFNPKVFKRIYKEYYGYRP
jgi:hypothetical protein